MRLLLDTHVWLWSALDPERLPKPAAEALADPDNEVWISPITVWETLVLAERKRVVLQPDPERWIRDTLQQQPLREAPLTHEVALRSRSIALPHRDPADRFLAATAIVFELTLVTTDRRLRGHRQFRTLPRA